MKRYLATLAAFAVSIGIFWVGGMEFERGFGLAFALVVSIVVAMSVHVYPGWKD